MNTKPKYYSWLSALAIVVAFILIFPLWFKLGKDKVYDKEGIREALRKGDYTPNWQ